MMMMAVPLKSALIIFGLLAALSGRGSQAAREIYRRGQDPSPMEDMVSCWTAKPYSSRSSYSYARGKGVSVGSCAALEDNQEALEQLENTLDGVSSNLTDRLDQVTARVDLARVEVDDLLGVDRIATPILLTKELPDGSVESRLICRVTRELEVAEICRALGFRIPNPAFFHLSCTDAAVVNAGITCPDSTWFFPQGCATADGNLLECAAPAPFPCRILLFVSCEGFTPNPGKSSSPAGNFSIEAMSV